jgi:tetratricopeptide (TPR) repeat protein
MNGVESMRRGDIPSLVFLVSFAWFLYGAAPAITVGDSGEFATAAATLGVPHAPGYPAYSLLSHLWLRLVPFGNPGYRMNLFSSVGMAGALTLFFLLAAKWSESSLVALILTGILLSSPALGSVAQTTEVFALHSLLVVLTVAAAALRVWPLAAFALGLGAANHQTIVLLFPALAFFWYLERGGDRRMLAWSVVTSLVGLSVYGLLMCRAQQEPFLNVGNPDTVERWWRVLRRADYGSFTLALGDAPPRDAATAFRQATRFFHGLLVQTGWPTFLLGITGIVGARTVDRRKMLVVLLGFLFIGPFFFLLGNLPFDVQSTGLLERFLVAPLLLWCLLAACGASVLLARRPAVRWVLIVCFPLALFRGQALAQHWRYELSGYAYGRNNLRTLPLNATFVMDGGDDTFYSLAYLTQVERRRADVQLYDRGGVVFKSLYGPDFRRLDRLSKEERRQQLESALLGRRPLFYSTMNSQILRNAKLVQRGILYEAVPAPIAESSATWRFYDLRGIAPWTAESSASRRDYRLRALIPFYSYQRAIQASRSEDWPEALLFARAAFAAAPEVLWLRPNLFNALHLWGYQAFQRNHWDFAETIYRQLIAWNVNDATAWMNFGAAQERLNRPAEAIGAYRQAIRLQPQTAAAHFNLAAALWKQGAWEEVVASLTAVVAIDPNYPNAHAFLQRARERLAKR